MVTGPFWIHVSYWPPPILVFKHHHFVWSKQHWWWFLRTIVGGFHLPFWVGSFGRQRPSRPSCGSFRQSWKHWTVGAIFNHQARWGSQILYCPMPDLCPWETIGRRAFISALLPLCQRVDSSRYASASRRPVMLTRSDHLLLQKSCGKCPMDSSQNSSSSTGRFQLGIFLSLGIWLVVNILLKMVNIWFNDG